MAFRWSLIEYPFHEATHNFMLAIGSSIQGWDSGTNSWSVSINCRVLFTFLKISYSWSKGINLSFPDPSNTLAQQDLYWAFVDLRWAERRISVASFDRPSEERWSLRLSILLEAGSCWWSRDVCSSMGLTIGRFELEAILDCLITTVEGGGTMPAQAIPDKQSTVLLLRGLSSSHICWSIWKGGRPKHSPPSKAELEHRKLFC